MSDVTINVVMVNFLHTNGYLPPPPSRSLFPLIDLPTSLGQFDVLMIMKPPQIYYNHNTESVAIV